MNDDIDDMIVDVKLLIEIAKQAGHLILSIYNQPEFEIIKKADNSPLTQADLESHRLIYESLTKLYPSIPIISEESTSFINYDVRKKWKYYFLIDPLDGTREFIKRNDEFTINIALIKKNEPILGIIHAPVLDVTYYAEKNKGAYKMIQNKSVKLLPQSRTDNKIYVVVSRSHFSAETKVFVGRLEKSGKEIIPISAGSALKFGLIAEGSADIYPRFSPTMEWDTAAGQIIVNEVGKRVMQIDREKQLQYNKKELVNPRFIVQ